MSDLASFDFEVTSTPVESARKGGPGRKRENPFDEPVMESYRQKFWERTPEFPKGRFMVIRDVPPDKVDSVVARIRNAARYNNIGSRVDVGTGKDAGVIAFRGTVPTKGPNAPQKDTDSSVAVVNDTDTREAAEYDENEEQY